MSEPSDKPAETKQKTDWLKVAELTHWSKEKLPKSLRIYRPDSDSLICGIEEKKTDGTWTRDYFKLTEPEASYLIMRLFRELMK
jgi:hypothetical protein